MSQHPQVPLELGGVVSPPRNTLTFFPRHTASHKFTFLEGLFKELLRHTLICCLAVREAEKAMAPHSSTLAWKIPGTEEPSGLQSMGSLRVGHN